MNFKRLAALLTALVLLLGMMPAAFAADAAALRAAKPSKIKITGSAYVAKGKKITLTATVLPAGASQKVKWKTSDKKIATVTSKGVVKGIKAGTVKITAVSAKNSKVKKTFTVTVTPKPVKKVKITAPTKELDLAGTKTVTLKAKASPSNAAQSFEWKSSDPKVAAVNAKGKVTAKGVGKAKITATATDGSKKKATVTVTVTNSEQLTGTYTVWCADTEVAKTLLAQLKKDHPEYAGLEFVVEEHSESEAVNEIADGGTPDLFTFAQDQIARLVAAGKLAKVSTSGFASDCGDGGVEAVSLNGTAYGYPITSDNGYFMYYDKNVITDPGSLTRIMADAETAGKKVYMELASGWYNVAFFYGAGCELSFSVSDEGTLAGADVSVANEGGVKALRAMAAMASSPAFENGSSFDSAENAAAVVSGVWDQGAARELFGDGYAAAKLPVAGGFQLSSFAGYKIIGVRPQEADRLKVAKAVAEYLSSTEAQVLRHDTMGWLPARKSAQKKVSLTAAEEALLAQNRYSRPQGQLPGGYWMIAGDLGRKVIDEASSLAASSDAALKEILQQYQNDLKALVE